MTGRGRRYFTEGVFTGPVAPRREPPDLSLILLDQEVDAYLQEQEQKGR